MSEWMWPQAAPLTGQWLRRWLLNCDALTAFNLTAASKACTDGAFSIILCYWILKVLSLQYGGQAGSREGWFTLQSLLAQKGCIIAATSGAPSQLLLIYRALSGGLGMARQDVCVCVWLVWSYIPCWLRIPLVYREVILFLPSLLF